jgi:F420-dependent oxidoreductase-like protein
MQIALMVEGQEGVTWEQWVALAEACEEHGIPKLCRSDHYLSMTDPAGKQGLDCWTVLAGLAARTTTPVTYRHPSALANSVATVDQISGGRAELGIGAGWNLREHEAFGFPFPETKVRVEMFAEQVEIVHRLWTEQQVDFAGKHYTLKGAPGLPKPVQKPHAPIIVGGGGGRGTARAAARFAQQYDTPFKSVEEFAAIRERVRAACEQEGRDPDTMRFSAMGTVALGDDAPQRIWDYGLRFGHETFESWRTHFDRRAFIGPVEHVIERLREFKAAGCDQVALQHLLHDDLDTVATIGREIVPALA